MERGGGGLPCVREEEEGEAGCPSFLADLVHDFEAKEVGNVEDVYLFILWGGPSRPLGLFDSEERKGSCLLCLLSLVPGVEEASDACNFGGVWFGFSARDISG